MAWVCFLSLKFITVFFNACLSAVWGNFLCSHGSRWIVNEYDTNMQTINSRPMHFRKFLDFRNLNIKIYFLIGRKENDMLLIIYAICKLSNFQLFYSNSHLISKNFRQL